MENQPKIDELRSALKQLLPSGRVGVLSEVQIGKRRADWAASLKLGGQRLKLFLEYKNVNSEARLKECMELLKSRQAEHPDGMWIFVAPFLSSSRQALLREQGVPFFDLAGNAWLWSSALHIDRRGFPNPFLEQRDSRDVFSDKASLVARSLIASGPSKGVRAIAEEVDLSPGYVSKIAQELERRGYVAWVEDGLVLRHGEELLQDWVAAYRKRPNLARGYFVAAPSAQAVMDEMKRSLGDLADRYALAGQAGASLVVNYAEFDVVDAYARDADAVDAMAHALDAREVPRGANLRLGVPYYRVSAFFDQQELEGLPVVSDLQLYLDLYDYPQRGREQAEQLFAQRLRAKLEAAERG